MPPELRSAVVIVTSISVHSNKPGPIGRTDGSAGGRLVPTGPNFLPQAR